MKFIRKVKPEFIDTRGSITKLLDDGHTNIKSILLITSKASTIRSNHYHRKDTHYIYMISGEMEYYEKPIKSKSKPQKIILKGGGIVYTPNMMIHATKFLKNSVFLAFSTKSRNQKAYENDTVRIKLI